MRAIKKLIRSITSALFTAALGEVFDWTHSVPVGERPRYSPRLSTDVASAATPTDAWTRPDGFKPSAG